MQPSDVIQLIAVVLGFIGVAMTVISQGRKSRWIQEQQLEEQKRTNEKMEEIEATQVNHGNRITKIEAELPYLRKK